MAVRNRFSPLLPILLGVLVLILGALACILPYWMCWEIDAKNYTPSWGAGLINAVKTTNPEAGSTVNAGLWWSDSEIRTGGQIACSAANIDDCVCNKIREASDRLRNNARDLLTNDPNDNDNDVDDATFNGHNSPIECWDAETDNCDAASATNGVITFTTKHSLKCDPQVLAPELRCGVEYADDDQNTVQNAAGAVVPVLARQTQSQSSTCGTTKVDDCMVDWINVSKIAYILAGLLLVLNLLLYALSGSRHPMKLPKWILICLLCSVLVFICLFVAFIAANVAFRWGCDNDWDRLEGDVSYGGAWFCGLIAWILALLFVIVGLSSWKKAKSIRDQYMYDAYSTPKYDAYPAYGYDYGYDANSYAAAYPATNYAYDNGGYGYGASAPDEGYGAGAPGFEYGEKGYEPEFAQYEQEAMPADADIGYGGIPMEEPAIEYEDAPAYIQ